MSKGGGVTGLLGDAIDVATAIFQPELLPVVAGAVGTGEGLISGESLGKALGQGAISGGEAFGGQELAGAAANAFPETAGELGMNTQGNTLTDILGQTSGAGSLTGPGTIGGDVASLFSSATPTVTPSVSSPSASIPGNPGASPVTGATGTGGASVGAPAPGAAAISGPSGVLPSDSFLNQTPEPDVLPSTSGAPGNPGSSPVIGQSQAPLVLPSTSGAAGAAGAIPILGSTPEPGTLPSTAATPSVPTPSGSSSGSTSSAPAFPGTQGGPVTLSNPNGSPIFESAPVAGTGGLPANADLANSVASNEANAFSNGAPAGTDLSVGGTPVSTDTLGQGTSLQDLFTNANIQNLNTPTSGTGTGVPFPGAATQSSASSFFNNPSVGGFINMLKANPSAVLGAGGLGLDALNANRMVKGQRQLNQEAGTLTGQANQLQSYLNTGTLPPGVQTSINQAAAAQKAAIQSKYASMGMSGSSSEQQELGAVDAWAQGEGAQVAMQLLNTGISESGLASSLYQSIANTALDQDKELGSAIGNFASSLGGGGGGQKFTLTAA